MLTILTGAPGAGKTCAMVSLMKGELGDRPLYVDGVNGLELEHEAIDVTQWHEIVPRGIGAVVCVDEGQRRWRPRGPGKTVPPDIEALETHRHDGLDFFITTQHPKLIDTNVRNLCGRHVHIRDLGVLGRWWYEWPEAADPGSWRSAPIKKKYKLDKKAFGLYKSASLHVKPLRSFPWMLIVLIAAVIGGIALAWMAYSAVNKRLQGVPVPGVTAPAKPMAGTQGTSMPQGHAEPVRLYLTDRRQFMPRFTGQPETAPAYDDLRKVVNMPRIVGGWCQGSKCKCINQQGRDAGITGQDCRAWLESPPFDPYTSTETVDRRQTPPSGPQDPTTSGQKPTRS
jgi:zona occludens toxin